MTRQRRGRGLYPADTAPVTTRAPHISDTVGARLHNIVVPEPTPADAVYAAVYLGDRGARDVAEVLGLADLYDRVATVRTAQREAV